MSKCSFSIPVSGSPQEMLDKARSAVEGNGGSFMGDHTSGSFSVQVMGSISGSYMLSGSELLITIDSKPMFIPCGTIESFLKSKMGGA